MRRVAAQRPAAQRFSEWRARQRERRKQHASTGGKFVTKLTESAQPEFGGTNGEILAALTMRDLNLKRYDSWRTSAASPAAVSLATGRRAGKGVAIGGRCSTMPITGASFMWST
jgi:hypothetical protein